MAKTISKLSLVWLLLAVVERSVNAGNITVPIGGVEFGELTTLIRTTKDVYQIEVDLMDPDKFVIADESSLKTTNGTKIWSMVGLPGQYAYKEGKSIDARFNEITGFTQLNKTTILAVDRNNHCLRAVDRPSLQTSTFAGQCLVKGFANGLNAKFYFPWMVIKDIRNPYMVLVTDSVNDAVRQVNTITRFTETLISRSSGLDDPMGIAFDFYGENLLITSDNQLSRFDLKNRTLSNIVGRRQAGFTDGPFDQARLKDPRALVVLSPTITLVGDYGSSRLKVVNEAYQNVSAICDGFNKNANGPVNDCSLSSPYSLLKHNGLIYMGVNGIIRTFPYSVLAEVDTSPVCPPSMTVNLDGLASKAAVNWITPNRVPVSSTFGVGRYDFRYSLGDGSECPFTVTVSDPKLMKRLDFISNFDIQCNLETSDTISLMAMLNLKFAEIEFICNGECKRSQKYGIAMRCSSDVTTVSWPTDVILAGTADQVPEHILTEVMPKLKIKHLLSVVVNSAVPPVVYPRMNTGGLAAKPVLTAVCSDNYRYNETSKRCIK